ncbi:hypothetical protein ACOMHN_058702 [Nucella lapillus]
MKPDTGKPLPVFTPDHLPTSFTCLEEDGSRCNLHTATCTCNTSDVAACATCQDSDKRSGVLSRDGVPSLVFLASFCAVSHDRHHLPAISLCCLS